MTLINNNNNTNKK